MKYLDEYRDERIARALAAEIAQHTTRPWVLMEICGGQTHTIMRYGIDELLPQGIELVHGPGCPVCVTPLETVDKAIELSLHPDVILVSYGDMLRVPGSRSDLFRAKAQGTDVRIAYSPTEAVKIARSNPERKVVFLAIGFETTAPANAMAAWQARREGLTNFSMLVSHVLAPPAIRALMVSRTNRVQGFIPPGHVRHDPRRGHARGRSTAANLLDRPVETGLAPSLLDVAGDAASRRAHRSLVQRL